MSFGHVLWVVWELISEWSHSRLFEVFIPRLFLLQIFKDDSWVKLNLVSLLDLSFFRFLFKLDLFYLFYIWNVSVQQIFTWPTLSHHIRKCCRHLRDRVSMHCVLKDFCLGCQWLLLDSAFCLQDSSLLMGHLISNDYFSQRHYISAPGNFFFAGIIFQCQVCAVWLVMPVTNSANSNAHFANAVLLELFRKIDVILMSPFFTLRLLLGCSSFSRLRVWSAAFFITRRICICFCCRVYALLRFLRQFSIVDCEFRCHLLSIYGILLVFLPVYKHLLLTILLYLLERISSSTDLHVLFYWILRLFKIYFINR